MNGPAAWIVGSSKLTGVVLPPGYWSWRGCGWSRGFSLVPRVQAVRTRRRWFAEAVGVAGFEPDDAVEAFGAGVRHPGEDGGDDLVFPAGDRAGECGQLGDLLVLRAPVVEGEEPVTRARAFSARRSSSFPIQARAACCPSAVESRVSMIFSNCSGDRLSRFFSRGA